MITIRTKEFYAGFIDGKIDFHGHGASIYEKKKEAKELYEDVRKIKVTYEVKI